MAAHGTSRCGCSLRPSSVWLTAPFFGRHNSVPRHSSISSTTFLWYLSHQTPKSILAQRSNLNLNYIFQSWLHVLEIFEFCQGWPVILFALSVFFVSFVHFIEEGFGLSSRLLSNHPHSDFSLRLFLWFWIKWGLTCLRPTLHRFSFFIAPLLFTLKSLLLLLFFRIWIGLPILEWVFIWASTTFFDFLQFLKFPAFPLLIIRLFFLLLHFEPLKQLWIIILVETIIIVFYHLVIGSLWFLLSLWFGTSLVPAVMIFTVWISHF